MREVNPEAKKYRKLFVGGLSRETNEADLKNYFEQWGKVTDCVVVRNPVTGISKGFSFLVFKESVTLDDIQACRPHIINNQCAETRRAMPYYKNPGELRNVKMVYTGRVRRDTTEDDIRTAFAKFGEIEKIEWVINNSGKYTGFLFLTFNDIDAVDKCVLQSKVLVNNTRIVVNRAVPQNGDRPPVKTPLPSNYLNYNPYANQCYPDTSGPSMHAPPLGPVYYTPAPVFNYSYKPPGNGTTYFSPSYQPTAYIRPSYIPFYPPFYETKASCTETFTSEQCYPDDCTANYEHDFLRQRL